MRVQDEIQLSVLFAMVLMIFCCSVTRARAELVSGDHTATPGSYRDTATPGFYQEQEEHEDLTAHTEIISYYDAQADMVISPAADMAGLLMEETMDTEAMMSAGNDEENENLHVIAASAFAELTGPHEVKVSIAVSAKPTMFHGFAIKRKNTFNDEGETESTDADVVITIPDYSTASPASPVVSLVRFGSVSIDSTNIRRIRSGSSRDIAITWTLTGADEIAAFARELTGDAIYVSLNGRYYMPGEDDYDDCINNGPLQVDGLGEYLIQAACHHRTLHYSSINDEEHAVTCADCGYVFDNEEHVMEDGSCTICGYSKIMTGTIAYILQHRTETESYSEVEGTEYTPRHFDGYLDADPVVIPAGGGDIRIELTPIRYTVVTDDHQWDVRYDELLYLESDHKKGYAMQSFAVEEVMAYP